MANSARSQMAEALARALWPDAVVWSAGSRPGERVAPSAVQVLRELGIDISAARPKPIADVPLGDADLVVTLCAEEVCPALPPSVRREHWPLADPAAVAGDDAQVRAAFRATRDELRRRIAALREAPG